MRALVLALWFVVGFTGVAFPMLAKAEGTVASVVGVQAATQTIVGTTVAGTCNSGYCVPTSTPNGDYWLRMCQAIGKTYVNSNNGVNWSCGPVTLYTFYYANNTSGQACVTGSVSGSNCVTYSCPTGYTLNGTTCTQNTAGSCPANSTGPSSGLCTCNNGFDPSGGSCVARVCPAAGNAAFKGQWFGGTGSTPSVVCVAGCGVNFSVCASGGGRFECQLSTTTGSTCTGYTGATAGATPATTEGGCIAQGLGFATINGITTCAPPSSSQPVTTTTATTKTVTDATGPTTTTALVTTTNNSSTVTTTNSTTTTPPGGQPATTTTTEEKPQAAFCQDNPTSPICKAAKPCEENPNTISCAEFGDVPDTVPLGTKSVGPSSLSPVSVGSNATCPADVPLPKGMAFSFAGPCMYASGLRPIILAMAWLTAGLILFGAIRSS